MGTKIPTGGGRSSEWTGPLHFFRLSDGTGHTTDPDDLVPFRVEPATTVSGVPCVLETKSWYFIIIGMELPNDTTLL